MTDRQIWQSAFLSQARCDWEAYRRTQAAAWPECHRLHFLQMATEKLGKAMLIIGKMKLNRIIRSHSAFVKFMQIASNNHRIQERLGMTQVQLKAHFRRLLPIVHEIEKLAPSLAQDGPNPEYPWFDKSSGIQTPANCSFALTKRLQTPQGTQLLRYLGYFFAEFERLFLR